jgi:hypothetical protein
LEKYNEIQMDYYQASKNCSHHEAEFSKVMEEVTNGSKFTKKHNEVEGKKIPSTKKNSHNLKSKRKSPIKSTSQKPRNSESTNGNTSTPTTSSNPAWTEHI